MRIHELGHVVLYVTDLKRSADFYRDTLGFREISRDDATALYSSGRTHHELLLIGIGGSPRERHHTEPGLYHIGFKIGDTPESLREAYRELLAKGVRIVGSGDHTVTHSLYILDPDGNELELYADVSEEWKEHPQAVLRPVRPLDLDGPGASSD
jgi:catechol 2,3-dioxygenase